MASRFPTMSWLSFKVLWNKKTSNFNLFFYICSLLIGVESPSFKAWIRFNMVFCLKFIAWHTTYSIFLPFFHPCFYFWSDKFEIYDQSCWNPILLFRETSFRSGLGRELALSGKKDWKRGPAQPFLLIYNSCFHLE